MLREPKNEIKVNLGNTLKLDFQWNRYIEYKAQPIEAPSIHKSPEVNFKLSSKEMSPFTIIIKTPIRQDNNPNILKLLIFSLNSKLEIKIINIGDEVYIIPIFTIVVVSPALYGKILQTPHPINPKKNNFLYSFLIIWKFFLNEI